MRVKISIRHRDSAAGDSSLSEGGDAEAANAEKDILRYYYYIRHGIDTQHVAPMEQYWMDNVLSLVPKRLQVPLLLPKTKVRRTPLSVARLVSGSVVLKECF